MYVCTRLASLVYLVHAYSGASGSVAAAGVHQICCLGMHVQYHTYTQVVVHVCACTLALPAIWQ